jgi:hypothetical protein
VSDVELLEHERAIARMRERAARRGMGALTSAAVAMNLSQHVMTTAPSGLIATTTGAATALPGSALALPCTPIAKGASIMIKMTTIKTIAASVVVGGVLITGTVALVHGASAPTTQRSEKRDFGGQGFPKLAPYNGIRWNDSHPEVRLDGPWYGLDAIDDVSATDIVAFTKKHYPDDIWQKRFEEDLVEVMTKMGDKPGDKVKLTLHTLDTKEKIVRNDVPMTRENRQQIWRDGQEREKQKQQPTTR